MKNLTFLKRVLWLLTPLLTLLNIDAVASSPESVNISSYASANSWSNGTSYRTVTMGTVTVTAHDNGGNDTGSNTGKYNSKDNSWRIYESESSYLEIDAGSGNELTSFTITFTADNNGTFSYGGSAIASGTAKSVASGNRTITTGTVGHSSGSSSGKIYITAISVTYTSSCTSINPSVTYTATTLFKDGTATVSSITGNTGSATVTYSTSNSTVLSVNSSTGAVTAGQAGTAKITASFAATGGYCAKDVEIDFTVRYQVKWSVAGDDTYDTGSPTTYIGTHNIKVTTLPTAPTSSDCDGSKEFVGWTNAEYAEDDDPPSTLFTTASSSPNVTNNVTYYAVFATNEGTGGEPTFARYQLVTSAPSDWSGTYVISTGTYTATGAYSSKSLTCSEWTPGTTEATGKEFVIAKIGETSTYSIKKGSTYYGYSGDKTDLVSDADGPNNSTPATAAKYAWQLSTSGIISNQTSTRQLAGNDDDAPNAIKAYATSNIPSSYVPVKLYKRIEEAATSYSAYSTSCETCEAPTAPTNGSITSSSQTVSWTAPSSGTPGDGYLVAYSKNYSTAPGDDVYETGDDEHFTVLTAATATASIPCNAEGTYYWWVRSKCSDSDFSSCSEWVEGDDWTMRAIYLNTNYEWYAGNAKFAIHYWNDDTPTPVSGWSKFMVEESGCATGIYKGFVPEGYNNINFGRFNPVQSTDPTDWTNRWNQTSDLTIPTSPAKDYFTLSSKTGDNDYNGSWSNYAPYYTISFNNNAVFSTTSAPSSQCILEGAKASAPTNPLAMGKEVDGWYKEAGCVNEWDFSTQTVSANQTLYAHWADVTSKTIYLDCSKDLSASPSDKKWDADNVVLFAHAYIDGTSIYTDVKVTSAINSCDAHVYAFEIPGNADYVTFARCATGATSIVWDGGSKNVYNQFSLAVEASKDWYKVTGWDAGSLESTAFAATTYTVSFAANSGSGTMSAEEVECDDDYTIKTNTFTRDCYAFTGWKADVDVKISGATVSAGTLITAGSTIQDVESNITLTAQWSQYSCTVTLNKNGATTGTNQTVSATCGSSMPLETTSSVAIAVPSKTGYTFLGYWDTDASSGGNQYYSYDGSTLSSYTDWDKATNTAQTLYARWEANVDHFIDDMHKTTGYTGSGHSESGANYTMPGPLSNVASGNECETNHYIFVGWVVASGQDDEGTINGTSKIYRPGETKSATNATYYAVWAEE